MEELVELLRLDPQDGRGGIDHPLREHVHCHVEGRCAGALAHPGLQHPQPPVLDGELDVLHIGVVLLEVVPDSVELVVDLGHGSLERRKVLVLLVFGGLVERVGGADARHHILALGVGQPLAVEPVVAGGRISGEGHAGGRGVAHVAKDHRLDVDRGPPVVGDALDAAVRHGALTVPRAEDSADSAPQLLLGVVGEVLAQDLPHLELEALG